MILKNSNKNETDNSYGTEKNGTDRPPTTKFSKII